MIVNDFDLLGPFGGPRETDPVLVIDTDAVLPFPIAPECLQAVPRREPELVERRLAAARLFRAGRLTPSEIAQRLGVSRAAVSQWRTGGDPRLKARSPGHRPARLTAADWRELGRLLDRGAVASGFETEQWTLKRIAHVIERAVGVPYHSRYLERPLKAHGFSVQRPASRARERDEQLG